MTTTQMNPFLKAIVAFETDANEMLRPALEAAATAASVLLNRMRSDTIAVVQSRLTRDRVISAREFYEMFAALDMIAEEVYLCEEVGLNQTLMYRWREFTQAPDTSERKQVLLDILAWVESYPTVTGEQIIAQEIEDLGWSEAYPDMPEHMKD